MSFHGSVSDAKGYINSVEVSENTRTSGGTSKILNGQSSGGGASKPAGETMSTKRTTLKTATSGMLRRKC